FALLRLRWLNNITQNARIVPQGGFTFQILLRPVHSALVYILREGNLKKTNRLAFNRCVWAVSGLIGYQSLESSIVRRPEMTQATSLRVLSAARTAMAVFLTYAMAVLPTAAQQQIVTPGSGGTILNGSFSGPSELGPKLKGAFLFEPEFPLASLKG